MISDLTYDLRSGDPDFLDKMVATTFATMAYDAVIAGKRGLMTAVSDGKFAMAAIPDPKLGPRKVVIADMYNTDRYRPTYTNKEGLAAVSHARLTCASRRRLAPPCLQPTRRIPRRSRKWWKRKATSSTRTSWRASSTRSSSSAAVSK